MRLVVADTGPLNQLVLIDAVELLPKLFDKIFVPVAVHREPTQPRRAGTSENLGGLDAGVARDSAQSQR